MVVLTQRSTHHVVEMAAALVKIVNVDASPRACCALWTTRCTSRRARRRYGTTSCTVPWATRLPPASSTPSTYVAHSSMSGGVSGGAPAAPPPPLSRRNDAPLHTVPPGLRTPTRAGEPCEILGPQLPGRSGHHTAAGRPPDHCVLFMRWALTDRAGVSRLPPCTSPPHPFERAQLLVGPPAGGRTQGQTSVVQHVGRQRTQWWRVKTVA